MRKKTYSTAAGALVIFLLSLLLPVASPAVEPQTRAVPPGGTYGKTISVTLEGPPGSTIYYTIDGSEPNTESPIYTSPLMLRTDAVLKFFSVGPQGERESMRQETYVFTLTEKLLDTTAPEVSADPPSGTYRGGTPIRLIANEDTVIHYTLDGSEPTERSAAYKNPLVISTNATVKFFALDKAGNRSKTRSEDYVFDAVIPVTTAYPTTGLYRPPIGVKLTASKEDTTIYFTTDGTPPTTASAVYREPIVLFEQTVLRFFSRDRLGNEEKPEQEEYFFDSTIPKTSAEPPAGEYPPPLTVSLRSKEGARIFFTLDGSEPTLDSPVYSDPILIDHPTTLRFFALDGVGNREPAQKQEYTISNGVWRKHARGIFLIPSVTDGETFWMGTAEGLVRYRVRSGSRQVLGQREGLLSSRINDLVLDEKGVLWVATDQGLARGDGERFTTFTREDDLPAREVLGLGVDVDNTIWAGTRGGVVHLKGDIIAEVLTIKNGLPDNNVLSVAVDGAGIKWFGTAKGLARYDGKRWKVFNQAAGLPADEVRTVAIDAEWRVWAGTPAGLAVFENSKWKAFTKEDGLPGNTITLVVPDQDGDIWVATTGGVVRYSKGKWIREERP